MRIMATIVLFFKRFNKKRIEQLTSSVDLTKATSEGDQVGLRKWTCIVQQFSLPEHVNV